MDKLEKKILTLMRDYHKEWASPIKVIEVSEKLESDGRDTLVKMQLLETGGYIERRIDMPGRPLLDGYIITKKGITALEFPYKKILAIIVGAVATIASIVTILSFINGT